MVLPWPGVSAWAAPEKGDPEGDQDEAGTGVGSRTSSSSSAGETWAPAKTRRQAERRKRRQLFHTSELVCNALANTLF